MKKKTLSGLSTKSINRRHFLKAAGAAMVLPAILPSSTLGREGKAPPSGKITMGVIGWGTQGPGNAKSFLGEDDCHVVAACDLDKDHLKGRLILSMATTATVIVRATTIFGKCSRGRI
jgi:hypothetical protein